MNPPDSLIGRTLGTYQIQREIGRGGMGVVYLAHEQSLQRAVAAKVLAPHLAQDEAYVARFVREARAVAQLDHPNIVTVHSVGEQDGLYYIAMQYVKGRSLAQLIREKGPLDWRRALDITRQAAEALAEAHKQGIIHRDIKPDNIMVDETGRVRVMDFGLARAMAASTKLTADGAQLGTPMYMSPEQINGDPVDTRTDIYSLGVTLFEMLTGRPPFQADTPMALMFQITQKPLPNVRQLNMAVPEVVTAVVTGMTAQQAGQRYPSAQVLSEHLDSVLSGSSRLPEHAAGSPAGVELDAQLRSDILGGDSVLETPQATPAAGPNNPAGTPPRRRRLVWIALAVVSGTLIIAALIHLAMRGDADQDTVLVPDANLEAALRQAIGKSAGSITNSDLAGLEKLEANKLGIARLDGLEHCTDLAELQLRSNNLRDIQALRTLSKLKKLWIDSYTNEIDDITPISALTQLEGLCVGADPFFGDLTPLSRLTNLTYLDIDAGERPFRDISPLSGLSKLTGIHMTHNKVADLSPLSALDELTLLDVGDNQARDITPLSGLSNLKELWLYSNQISDIGALSKLEDLETLVLSDNQISDITALVDNPGLGNGDEVFLTGNTNLRWTPQVGGNPLSQEARERDIPALQARGVTVHH